MPTSTIAVWPARGTSAGLGSVIVPMKLGRFAKVTLVADDVGVARGIELEGARVTDGGVVLMMKLS